MTDITADMLSDLWPNGDSRIPGLIDGIVSTLPTAASKFGISNDLAMAHFMAQVSHECGAGTEVVENLNYSANGLVATWPSRFNSDTADQFAHQPHLIANKVYNGRMGNAIGTDDGWNYRGRGATQTTGKDAYQRLGDAVGLDLISQPDLLNDPAHFIECGACDFVTLCNCLEPALADDLRTVTRRLNGGYIGIDQRSAWLAKWKDALGVGASDA